MYVYACACGIFGLCYRYSCHKLYIVHLICILLFSLACMHLVWIGVSVYVLPLDYITYPYTHSSLPYMNISTCISSPSSSSCVHSSSSLFWPPCTVLTWCVAHSSPLIVWCLTRMMTNINQFSSLRLPSYPCSLLLTYSTPIAPQDADIHIEHGVLLVVWFLLAPAPLRLRGKACPTLLS